MRYIDAEFRRIMTDTFPDLDDNLLAANDYMFAEDADFDAGVKLTVRALRIKTKAQKLANIHEQSRLWVPPSYGGSLAEQLKKPRKPDRYLIQNLIGEKHNISINAQYKTGKTTLGENCARCLVDRLEFLNHETFLPDGARVGWWNGEMDEDDWVEDVGYMGIQNPHRICPLHLRGQRMPLLNDYIAEWVVKWLRTNDIAVWWLDSWRRACTWSGVKENLNEEVEQLTDRIDQIKKESGCQVFVTLAHTGRAPAKEGEERARGATALDDWVDARWVLAKNQQGTRFLYADGRKRIHLPETALVFDHYTNLISLGEGNRQAARIDVLHEDAVKCVNKYPGSTTTEIQRLMDITKNGVVGPVLKKAENLGQVYSIPIKPKGARWWPGQKVES